MTRLCSFFLVSLLIASATRATEHPSCVLTPEVRQVLAEFSPGNVFCASYDKDCWPAREQALRSAVAGLPSQIWISELLRLYELRNAGAGKEAVIERLRLAAEAAPNDPAAQYFWGASLPEIEPSGVKRALELDPSFPLALMAASSVKGLAPEAALALLEKFMAACPARAAVALLAAPSLPNAEFWRPHFTRLRASLPTLLPGEKVALLQALWTAEFKVLPKEEHEALTRQMTAELAEMETWPLETWPSFWAAQRSAYDLLGRDPDPLERRRAKYFPCETRALQTAKADARRALGLPGNMAEAFSPNAEQLAGLVQAYDRLVDICPRDPMLQNERLTWVKQVPEIPGERVVALVESAAAAWEPIKANLHAPRPAALTGAEILLERGLAPELALRLAVEAQELLAGSLAWVKRMKMSPEQTARMATEFRTNEARAHLIEAELRLARGEKAAAREKLLRAHAVLTEPEPITAGSGAMSYVKVRTLLAAADPEAPALPELGTAGGQAPAATLLPWQDVDEELGTFPVVDPFGKTWQLTDLQGKVWLVNLWATWCIPCMAELPHIQKLHEEFAGRSDVGVFTLNFDTNTALVKPFLEKKGFTFPVLLATDMVEETRRRSIPQTWLVDRAGKVRRKATGFPAEAEKFLAELRQELDKLKTR